MEKWNGFFGTFNPKPINRKKYSFLWPNLEFSIELVIYILLLSAVVEKAMTFG